MTNRLLPALLATGLANLGLTAYHLTTTRAASASLQEEHDARMDELEGTLRGHIGLIEDSLERIEKRQQGGTVEGGWGKGMSEKAEGEYVKRGRDGKKEDGKK